MANERKLDYVILGLLSHEDLTGYEIKKRIDAALHFFWGASFGSIYPTLRGLVDGGLVAKSEAGGGDRNKIAYAITAEGRDRLVAWLEIPAERDEIRYETLLKLFFAEGAGPETAVAHIERFEAKTRRELAQLERSVEILKGTDGRGPHPYYLATALLGVKSFAAYLEWCEEAKRLLRADSLSS